MESVIILGVVVVVLFVLAFLTKRRFGVLALALAAGYVLSASWARDIEWAAALLPFDFEVPSPVTVISLLVILLPSIILLFGGPAYSSKKGRIVGSLLYALTAVLFGLGALEHTLVLMGASKDVFDFLMEYRTYILTGALVWAVLDIMHVRTGRGGGEKHRKHDKKH